MTQEELRDRLANMINRMDTSIGRVQNAAMRAQQEAYKAAVDALGRMDVSDGRLVINQNYAARILALENTLNELIQSTFNPSLSQYFNEYRTVQDTNISLQRSFNDLEVDVSKLSAPRAAILSQAQYFLTEGVAPAYVQPVKYILMQQVTTGIRIDDATRQLRNWNEGVNVNSTLASGEPAPRLDHYAVQIARDSIHQYNGAINNIISNEYDLKNFIYVGGLVKDSRPFCRHLVGLRRKIALTEVPPLVDKYPEGLYANTTMKNFFQVRGGYGCRHTAFPVK